MLELGKRLQDVFETDSKIMLAAAYGVLRNRADAEDAVQDAFEKLLRYPETVNKIPFDDLRPYLIIVAKHAAFTILRKKANETARAQEIGTFFFEEKPLDITGHMEDSEAFLLPEIKDIYRDVLVLMYYYDFSVAHTAKILDTTEDNIRVRLHRVLKQLRQGYKDAEESAGKDKDLMAK